MLIRDGQKSIKRVLCLIISMVVLASGLPVSDAVAIEAMESSDQVVYEAETSETEVDTNIQSDEDECQEETETEQEVEEDDSAEESEIEQEKVVENNRENFVEMDILGDAIAPAALSDYHADDVAVINRMIQNNGLNWAYNNPDAWPTYAINKSSVRWSEVNGKLRVTMLIFPLNGSEKLSGDVVLTGLNHLMQIVINTNPNLTSIEAKNIPALGALNVSNCAAIKSIDMSGSCTNVDTSMNGIPAPALNVNDNIGLETIKFAGCTMLRNVYAYDCNLRGSIDASGLTNLKTLEVDNYRLTGDNRVTSINAKGCISLEELYFEANPVEYLDISNCNALKSVGAYGDRNGGNSGTLSTATGEFAELTGTLKTMIAANCTWLKEVTWSGTVIQNLDVSGCTGLEKMTFSNNTNLSSGVLDLSRCTALTTLTVSGNRLSGLNLTGCNSLVTLDCSNNILVEAMDLTDCAKLTTLNCSNNQMKRLDLSGCVSLVNLICHSNPFSYFNVSGCVKLSSLTLISGSTITELPMETFINRNGDRLDISSDEPEGKVWMTGYTHSSGAMTFRAAELTSTSFVDWKINGLTNNTGSVDNKSITVTMQMNTNATLHANFKIIKKIHYVYYSGTPVEDAKIGGQTIAGGVTEVLLADVGGYLETDNYTSVGYMLNTVELYTKDNLAYWSKTDTRNINDPSLADKNAEHVYIVLESFEITADNAAVLSGNTNHFGYILYRTVARSAIIFTDDWGVNKAAELGYSYTISGNFAENSRYFIVRSGVEGLNLILKDTLISHNSFSAISIETGASTNIFLSGKNTLKNTSSANSTYACLGVTGTAVLNIDVLQPGDTSSSLLVEQPYSTAYGAAIGTGGGNNAPGVAFNGEINIKGGKITAQGSTSGAGIGTGYLVPFNGKVSISGGEVTAYANSGGLTGAAGIGCANQSAFNGEINISGGKVTAYGSVHSAAIGSGSSSNNIDNFNGVITISGGHITATGSGNGAGIGTGNIGKITTGAEINISDGTVIAEGGVNGAGIGTASTGSFSGAINISGGTITASSNTYGAGIGTGYQSEMAGEINITGGTIIASSPRSAGIGGGHQSKLSGIITISDGNITATGGTSGAGIGTAAGELSGSIRVLGGEIKASAGNYGAGIGAGYQEDFSGTVQINAGSIIATGGPMGGSGIGAGSGQGKAGSNVSIGSDAVISAYAKDQYYAIDAETVSGNGQFVNAYFTDGVKGSRQIFVTVDDVLYTTLQLPANYSAFAYTTKSTAEKDTYLMTPIDNINTDIMNGDYKDQDNQNGYGPHGAAYGETKIRTMSAAATPWPVTTTDRDVTEAKITVYYYYFDAQGTAQLFDAADMTAGSNPVIWNDELGADFTLDLTQWGSLPYSVWYYTIDEEHTEPGAVKKYPADTGGSFEIEEEEMVVYIYTVSTMLSIEIPADSFFWYANEDTMIDAWINADGSTITVADNEIAYAIQSVGYKMENHGLTGVLVELTAFEQAGVGRRNGIEKLLNTNSNDELVLNLTGDLAEGDLGQDLFKKGNGNPFGVYSNTLNAGTSFVWSFGGQYYPESGSLPASAAASDYRLTFTFELDLSGS